MNLHLQAVLALTLSAYSGHTASMMAYVFSNTHKGQPLPALTEFTLTHATGIYFITLPLLLIALWLTAIIAKKPRLKTTATLCMFIITVTSALLLQIAWNLPVARTTFALS